MINPPAILPISILYEDEDVLVVNKPAGLVVNRSDTTSTATLQDWLLERFGSGQVDKSTWESLVPSDFTSTYGTPAEIFEERVGVAHRLDKDTSGVLLIAKNPGALVNLLAQFRERKIEKEYLALVHGKVKAPQATLSFPLGRASRDRKLFAVQADGREAVTQYQVEQLFSGLDIPLALAQIRASINADESLSKITDTQLIKRLSVYQGFSLVKCWPKTGRTHQIRVHLAHITHPIVGDITYVGKKRQQLDPWWCPRHFLHAQKLTLTHPRTGERMTLTAPLTSDLEQVLELLVQD